MTQPAPTKIPVHVAGELRPGPDGKPWPTLTLHQGLTSFTLTLPEATADELAPIVAKALHDLAAAARREALGLIIPTPHINGNGPKA